MDYLTMFQDEPKAKTKFEKVIRELGLRNCRLFGWKFAGIGGTSGDDIELCSVEFEYHTDNPHRYMFVFFNVGTSGFVVKDYLTGASIATRKPERAAYFAINGIDKKEMTKDERLVPIRDAHHVDGNIHSHGD